MAAFADKIYGHLHALCLFGQRILFRGGSQHLETPQNQVRDACPARGKSGGVRAPFQKLGSYRTTYPLNRAKHGQARVDDGVFAET